MAEVQWIKFYIDMFDRRKINKIRRLPDGDKILLFWVMLLATAGKCNAGGMIFITERVPFTKDDLADEFDFEPTTIELALKTFVELDMIDLYDDGFISVRNWKKYQSEDKLAEIREQNRLRQAKFKQKQKLLAGNVADNVTVTLGNAIEEEKEQDIDITTTTTPCARACEAPTLIDVYFYIKSIFDGDFRTESEKFHAYNERRGWDCLPDWKLAANVWVARIGG